MVYLPKLKPKTKNPTLTPNCPTPNWNPQLNPPKLQDPNPPLQLQTTNLKLWRICIIFLLYYAITCTKVTFCHLYHANFNPIVYSTCVLTLHNIIILCDYITHVTTPYIALVIEYYLQCSVMIYNIIVSLISVLIYYSIY